MNQRNLLKTPIKVIAIGFLFTTNSLFAEEVNLDTDFQCSVEETRIFIYEKTKSMPLKYLRIKKVIKKEVASLLWVEGCSHPFTIPRPPEQGMNWAGILHLHGLPWMLYEYSETKQKNTHRKV